MSGPRSAAVPLPDEAFRLSPPQRRLWRLMRQRPGDGYRMSAVVRLPSQPDHARLAAAIARAATEVETSLVDVPGLTSPVMVRARTPDESGLEARIDPARGELRLTVSPLLADAESLRLLARTIARGYHGRAVADAPRYVDVAAWLNELVEQADADGGDARAFWRDRARVPRAAAWPFATPDAGTRTFHTAVVDGARAAPIDRLRTIAAQLAVAVPDVLFAAWHLLLQILLREEDVFVGRAFAGRSYEGLEHGIGVYNRYLPTRSVWMPDASFAEIVRGLHAQCVELSEYQEYFAPATVANAGRDGGAEEETEAESSFLFHAIDLTLDEPGGFQLDEVSAVTEPFVIRLRVTNAQAFASLGIAFDYDIARCHANDVTRLARWYGTLLDQALADPDILVRRLPILTTTERRALRRDGAGPRVARPRTTFHGLFERQAAATPDRLAVRTDTESLTYEQLNRRAESFAAVLREAGVRARGDVADSGRDGALGASSLVGLCVDRSPAMLIGLLGILKAGAAYVPIDRAWPGARQQLVLANAPVDVLVTNDAGCARQAGGRTIIASDIADARPSGAASRRFASRSSYASASSLDDLAYVLYTSGSTGEPKGVAVSHHNLVHYAMWAVRAYGLAEGTGTIVHSPLTFDLTVTSLLAPLLAGQTVHLLPDEAGIQDLAAALDRARDVSLVKITPAHLALLHDVWPATRTSAPAGSLSGRVRCVVIGGEALHWDTIAPWLRHAPATRLFNEYGPTEASVGCCFYEVRARDRHDGAVPIGRPIANTRLCVLDGRGHLMPHGAIGEIYVAGPGVARGYLHQPDLTAAAFVSGSPLGRGRAYRTGDLARVLADGNLEFVGRADRQIKIAGHRVEPGEVEAVLLRDPAIRRAAVVARADATRAHDGGEIVDTGRGAPAGSSTLIAYVAGPSPLEAARVRAACAAALPAPCVPAAIVVLPELPLTPHGKVDLSRLPAPDARPAPGVGGAPRTIQEAALARAWSTVLGRTHIGIDDDYFALGGDSIRSLRVVSEARAAGLDLSVAQVFQHPTIRRLAAVAAPLDAAAAIAVPEPFALVRTEDRERLPDGLEDAYPLTMLQAGMIFHNDLEPGASRYHDVFSYRLRMPVRPEPLRAAADLLTQHAALRTTYDLTRFSEPLQLVHRTGVPLLTIVDLRDMDAAAQDEEVRTWLAHEKRRGFDITRLPLVRLQIHLRASEEAQVTLSFHHAAIDGWSDVSLLTEFFSAYFRLTRGEPVCATPPETPYRHFVALERQAAASAESRRYWSETLDGATCVSLPRDDYDAGDNDAGETHARGDVSLRRVSIGREISDRLKALAVSEALPAKSLLLAAHMRVIGLLGGCGDVLSAIVTSGRPERPDAERTIGLFINTVPVRLRFGRASWTSLAHAAYAAERDALPHRRFPWSEIQTLMSGPTGGVSVPRAGGGAVSWSLFYFTHYHLIDSLPPADRPEILELIPHESSSFPLVANFWIDPFTSDLALTLAFHDDRFSPEQMDEIAGYYQRALESMAADPEADAVAVRLLSEAETQALLAAANGPAAPVSPLPIHEQIADQVRTSPNAVALIDRRDELTYAQLIARADALAAMLRAHAIQPGECVAVLARRRLAMVWAILGVWRAGGAYLPLDPTIPRARRDEILRDSGARVIVVDRDDGLVDAAAYETIPLETLPNAAAAADGDTSAARAADLDAAARPAYWMYTSGSTGSPHAVIVTHDNLTHFVAAMDAHLGREPGVWLALTHYTFDISILELFWTLARGYTVVVQGGPDTYLASPRPARVPARRQPMAFSLFYFAAEQGDAYRLLMEGARFADRHGLEAVWTPERHFHDFGGPYPNPAVTAAAVAAITSRIGIRAGSVVLPLHHPIRVAEEWSVVDNLSRGRVGVSFASGWHRRDFVLAAEGYDARKAVLVRHLDAIRRLWRGETIRVAHRDDDFYDVRLHPRPIQPELPVWLSAAGDPATFTLAGDLGAHVLTHVLGQSLEDLSRKIAHYRTRTDTGRVTLMLHTFIDDDAARARDIVHDPFVRYMRRSVDLTETLHREFGLDAATLPARDADDLLERAFSRYFEHGGLFGTPSRCLEIVSALRAIGVDEIACLIDFGVDADTVLRALHHLADIQRRDQALASAPIEEEPVDDESIAAQIHRHRVTHVQCTPTVAAVLADDTPTSRALGTLRALLVGGEALPPALARRLTELGPERLLNMYGPTEATIWTTSEDVAPGEEVTIGRPLPNMQAYVLDAFAQPAPVGVAGELYLGGPGVARGYHGLPELTSARYLPDPFSRRPHARLYRTGDRARRRRDGRIAFLGRIDDQVKIAGHRIEGAEVEAVLSRHPAVAQCAVVAVDQRLVAYVVARGEIEASVLQTFLLDRLPPPMVPEAIVLSTTLPRTSSGKLDRRALRAPRDGTRVPGVIQPRTDDERAMAAIWRDVLKRETIGIDTPLFELGGHSLQAAMIVSRVRERFQVDVPLRALFDHPTVAAFTGAVSTLTVQSAPRPALLRRRDPARARLSYAQERLWFIEQIAPGTAAYHDAAALDIDGTLDPIAVERSLDALFARHESLRTTFVQVDGDTFQRVRPASRFHLDILDLSNEPDDRRESVLASGMIETARTPFDFQHGPLVRVRLYRLGPDRHVLLLIVHHLVCDGWSLNIAVREIAAAYRGETDAAPLEIQYADYAEWQREHLASGRLDVLRRYWRARLADAPVVCELPLDRPRPAVESFHGRTARFDVPCEIVSPLEEIGRANGATLFMTLLAGFFTLIHRYTGRDQLVVGTDVANRELPPLEPLIGFFVNALLLMCTCAGNPSFRTLLAHVRDTTLSAYDHQDLPFDRLVDELQPTRDLGRNPLYQIAFTLQEAPPIELGVRGLTFRHRAVDVPAARLDLEINLHRTDAGIAGKAIYNDSLFDASTIDRLLAHYLTLLRGIIANPDRRIADLRMISADEERQLVHDWNQTSAPIGEVPFPRLFEDQAARTPDAPAAIARGVTCSYRELNARANRLGHAIAAEGLGAEPIVAVLARRGIGLLTSMLGVLKAGAVYLPLDPGEPPARHAQVLERSRCPLVLWDDDFEPALRDATLRLSAAARPRLAHIDRFMTAATRADNLDLDYSLSTLAYVIFTSGSTGTPKGAMIEHRGMLNHLRAKVMDLNLTAADRVAQTAPQCFDISIWQYLAPLLAGASVLVYDDDVARSGWPLLRAVDVDAVTVLETVPSLLHLMLDDLERRRDARPALESLRWLIATGEQLPASLCRRWLGPYPRIPVMNAYGPTECSDDVTHGVTRIAAPHSLPTAPIGRPLANTRIYIVSPSGEPAPIGTVGELLVGGVGVGRGYLHDPERTAERFVADPFSGEPGARLYRTGDLARYLPNGEIVYLGRADTQVKISGCRLELGEIEAVLDAHPAVAGSVVIARDDADGRPHLVAYVVPRAAALDPGADDEHRRERLSEWQRLYDQIYGAGALDPDSDLPTIGWNSSYTGQPIPRNEMQEWVETTVARILALRPSRVLEIGCGTGMLLDRIAPHCTHYHGTDISASVLDFVRQRLAREGERLSHVHLSRQPADDFIGIAPRSVDTVILNSVAQYLPSITHLVDVIAGATRALTEGGRLFIGDVRHLGLLEVFHSAVQRAQAGESADAGEIWSRVQRRVGQEEELVIDPAFFFALIGRVPGLTSAEVFLKAGRALNELTRFRYDVVLYAGKPMACGATDVETWSPDDPAMQALRDRLTRLGPARVEVRGVPNARLTREVRDWKMLRGADGRSSEVEPEDHAVEADALEADYFAPDAIAGLFRNLPYAVQLTWCPSGERDRLAIRLTRQHAGEAASTAWPREAELSRDSELPWSAYANNPLQGKFAARLAPSLREHLRVRLPAYMAPSDFVFIPEIPLTRNGKIDHRRLPPPAYARPALRGDFAAPRDDRERTLAGIWAEVLRLDRVGIHDNFFELGGDSIISIQVVARANQVGLPLTLRQAFQHQTIAALAAAAAAPEPPPTRAEQHLVTGPTELLPMQARFFEAAVAEPHHWNQSILLRLRQPLTADCIERAFQHLVTHHDGLRLRCVARDDDAGEGRYRRWDAHIASPDARAITEVVDLSAVPESGVEAAIAATAARTHPSLDLSAGPLLRAVLYDLGAARAAHLLIVCHHLIIDAVSWRVLVEDLETACLQASRGEAVRLPPKTTSVTALARRLHEHSRSADVTDSIDRWLASQSRLPIAASTDTHEVNTVGASLALEVHLSIEDTRRLLDGVRALAGGSVDHVLLAAILHAFHEYEGRDVLTIEIESHGRDLDLDDLDVSRTIAWCACAYPVTLRAPVATSFIEQVGEIGEQVQRCHPIRIHYGLARYGADSALAARLASLPPPAIAFNYFGQLDLGTGDGLFAPSALPHGPARAASGRREYAIEIDCAVRGGRLELRLTFCPHLHTPAFIDGLAASARTYLTMAALALARTDAREMTAELSADEWQAALAEVRFHHGSSS